MVLGDNGSSKALWGSSLLPELQSHFQNLLQVCLRRRLTFGFAESCTGGLLSAHAAMTPGISSVYKGSIVSYSSDIKIGILGVPHHAIQSFGEVSAPVARYMSQGAKKHLNCDWSVSITGVAGPGGGSLEKPVGTVYFSVCGPGFENTWRKNFEADARVKIQQQSVKCALELLESAMK